MSRPDRVVVVGASVAGVTLAESLREAGHTGEVVLVDAEAVQPYDKPPLSKAVLTDEGVGVTDVALRPASFYADLDIKLLLGVRALEVDPDRQVLRTSDGEQRYDKLVLATGASAMRPRWLPPLDGVHVLRGWGDAERLRTALVPGARLVVVGAGFIGCEVAASARSHHVDVTVVELLDLPLAPLVGDDVANLIAAAHREAGVTLRTGCAVTGLLGNGRVEAVELSDGTVLPADVVVVGVGARPDTTWLASSGVGLDDGVLCDEYGRTSLPSVLAVGDVARRRVPSADAWLRSEHWTAAVAQAEAVGISLARCEEDPVLPTDVAFFWTDQYELKVQVSGERRSGDELHLRETAADGARRLEVWSRDGRVSAAVSVSWPAAGMRWRARIGRPVDELAATA